MKSEKSMVFKVKYSKEAFDDLQRGIDYYIENASKKISQKFSQEVKKTVKSLKTNPYFQFRTKELRAVPLKKFPFLIFFTVNETEKIILIARIFHTSQNPVKYP